MPRVVALVWRHRIIDILLQMGAAVSMVGGVTRTLHTAAQHVLCTTQDFASICARHISGSSAGASRRVQNDKVDVCAEGHGRHAGVRPAARGHNREVRPLPLHWPLRRPGRPLRLTAKATHTVPSTMAMRLLCCSDRVASTRSRGVRLLSERLTRVHHDVCSLREQLQAAQQAPEVRALANNCQMCVASLAVSAQAR